MLIENSMKESLDINNNPVATKQVFIIGSRRSGTTWTLWLLSNHSSIVGVQHTNLIDSFKKINVWWKNDDPYRNSIVTGDNEKNKSNLKQYITDDDFYAHCRELMDMVFSKAFNEKKDATIIVESQPENIDNLDLLMSLYPEAYYLHVIRDPRSVFSSWKSIASTWSTPSVFKTHPIEFSERWLKDITQGRLFSEKVKNYMEIKYEDLQNNGVAVLQNVYKWLEVESNREVAEHSIDACLINKLRKKANMPQGFFRKGESEGWKDELSAVEIKTVEYMLKELMDELAYERVNKNSLMPPLKVVFYNMKNDFYNWLRSTFAFNILRNIKRRILGA